MGIRINEFDYGDNCLACYPINLTPKFIMVSLTDIKPGTAFNPAVHAPPPNRIFKMTQEPFSPCEWGINDGTYWPVLNLGIGASNFILHNTTGILTIFDSGVAAGCSYAWPNILVTKAGSVYYGGRAQVSWVPPTGDVSLRSAVENMGIDPDDDIWVDWYPKDDDTMIIRVIRGEDHSRIHGEHDF